MGFFLLYGKRIQRDNAFCITEFLCEAVAEERSRSFFVEFLVTIGVQIEEAMALDETNRGSVTEPQAEDAINA